MRRALLLGLAALAVYAQTVTTLIDNGPSANRVDILVVGDGYTTAELPKFAQDARSLANSMFSQEPLKRYERVYNLTTVSVASAESGADHPERNPAVFKNTAFDATYNCSGIARLICVNTTKVNAAISGLAPDRRDLVVVLVNDDTYGGSGGPISVASTNALVVELVLHEAGHSFALLTDEYGGPGPPACSPSTEPSAANATRETVRGSIKWNAWIAATTPIPTSTNTPGIPGLYEGSNYCDTGKYRPTFDSKMRSLSRPFEQINAEQWIKRMYNFVDPIESSLPAASVLSGNTGQPSSFSVALLPPLGPTAVAWTVNGTAAGSGASFSYTPTAGGTYTVSAVVADPTDMVRTDSTGLLRQTRTWTLNVTTVCGFSLNTATAQVAKAGGTAQAAFTATLPSCAWTASSDSAWLTIGAASGTGSGSVQYTATANASLDPRVGRITIGGQVLTVVQSGRTETCSTVLSKNSESVAAQGVASSVSITQSALACGWTASSNSPWVQVFPLSGAGLGTIQYTVYPNFTTQSRTAIVSASGQTFAITQAGMTGTANERFVRRAYFNVLRRVPSTADEAFHVASLATRTRAQVMQSFLEGGEFRAGGAFVTGLYRVLLGRVPESGGWAFQLNSVVSFGTAQSALASAFLGTPEWLLKQGASVTNEQFVRLLFQEVLGRQPSSDELAFQLPGASNRGQLATNFLGIPEFWARNGPLLNALHAYFVILGRDPTPSELTTLEARLRAGTTFATIVAEFVNSAEHSAALQ